LSSRWYLIFKNSVREYIWNKFGEREEFSFRHFEMPVDILIGMTGEELEI
jgi:hypothetical protein